MNTENYRVVTVETTKHKKPRLTSINEVLSTGSKSSAMQKFNDLVSEGKKVFVALIQDNMFQRYYAKNFDQVFVLLP